VFRPDQHHSRAAIAGYTRHLMPPPVWHRRTLWVHTGQWCLGSGEESTVVPGPGVVAVIGEVKASSRRQVAGPALT